MSKRTRSAILIALLLVLLVVAAVYLNQKAPPTAARLLPEADAIVFVNMEAIRDATHLDRKPVEHAEDYQKFIDGTGIVIERDLDSVALGLHRMPDAKGPNGAVAFSEVLLGKFDGKRLRGYLQSIAAGTETYAGHPVFLIPIDLPAGPASTIVPTGRVLRVSILDRETIAASNAPTPEQIHAMLDRFRTRSYVNPLSGPTLLAGLYPEVPIFSGVWGIGAIGLPFAEEGHVSIFGLHLPLPDTTPFVASLRYTTGLRLRVEQIATDAAEAERSVAKLRTLLKLFRQMQQFQSTGSSDWAVRKLMDSVKIEQHSDRAILTAEVPAELVHRMTTSAGPAASK